MGAPGSVVGRFLPVLCAESIFTRVGLQPTGLQLNFSGKPSCHPLWVEILCRWSLCEHEHVNEMRDQIMFCARTDPEQPLLFITDVYIDFCKGSVSSCFPLVFSQNLESAGVLDRGSDHRVFS